MEKKDAKKIEEDFRKTKRGKTFYRWGIIVTIIFFIAVIGAIICNLCNNKYYEIFNAIEEIILPITVGVDVYYLGALNQYTDDHNKKK